MRKMLTCKEKQTLVTLQQENQIDNWKTLNLESRVTIGEIPEAGGESGFAQVNLVVPTFSGWDIENGVWLN